MNIKKDIFENNAHPFTVPDGYFDTLQERIMSRIHAEESTAIQKRIIRMTHFKALVAAAACLLLIFTGAAIYIANTSLQATVTHLAIDEDFYRWFYATETVSQMAESLDIHVPESIMTDEEGFSDEDKEIIYFLERDNIHVAAILYSFDNEIFLFP